ncbi:hypothetical protein [uncultured Corynebacterium sp.]|uniref:hypothetical protein n=1 Tax=uncultured Corynebacterium sp. TaxID=159447 RepID=UPI0025EDD6BC|nr:hypothetical protein [uncultured Corynebacterium sp.]
MTLTDKLAQLAFDNVRNSTEDEYQEQTLFQSFAVGYYALPATLCTVGAILAWILHGWTSYLSFLVIIPLLVSEGFSNAWLKDKAPRAKAVRGTGYYIATFVPLAFWIAGLAFRTVESGDSSNAIGLVVGAIVGGIAAAIVTPRILDKRRAQDKERLEATLED